MLSILETSQPLSKSLLWQIQRTYFEQQGIEAWRQGTVPHYVTSNPYLAHSYARVIAAFLEDIAPTLDSRQPVYLIELGAGSGRMAYHLLQQLLPLTDVPFQLIVTDFAPRTLEFWRSHPHWQPFVASGRADFALFDAAAPAGLTLHHTGQPLNPLNPLILLANYFFDSIPQDCFTIQNGQLHEDLLTLAADQPEPDLAAPGLLERLVPIYDHHPISLPYYHDPALDQVLGHYLPAVQETTFLFPNVGLQCLAFFRRLSCDRLLLLTGDKGYHQLADLPGRADPHLNVHGSFSVMVNYHALLTYSRQQGGQAYTPTQRATTLNILALRFGGQPCPRTGRAYTQAIAQAGPDDYFSLKKALDRQAATMNLEEWLAWLRHSHWDGAILFVNFPHWLELVKAAPKRLRPEIEQAVQALWNNYYPLGEAGQDLPFCLGMILLEIEDYANALPHFQQSLLWWGPDKFTYYQTAICHLGMGQKEAAQTALAQALTLDPQFGPAVHLQSQLIDITMTPL